MHEHKNDPCTILICLSRKGHKAGSRIKQVSRLTCLYDSTAFLCLCFSLCYLFLLSLYWSCIFYIYFFVVTEPGRCQCDNVLVLVSKDPYFNSIDTHERVINTSTSNNFSNVLFTEPTYGRYIRFQKLDGPLTVCEVVVYRKGNIFFQMIKMKYKVKKYI